jgi:hypothetical protein
MQIKSLLLMTDKVSASSDRSWSRCGPKPSDPTASERAKYGRWLGHAEQRIRDGKPPTRHAVPKWARAEVRRGIEYVSSYAATGVAFDPESGGSVSEEQIITPNELAYEARQLSIAHRFELSKQRGAGNEYQQQCDNLEVRAAKLTGEFEGAITTLESFRKMGGITEEQWVVLSRAAAKTYKLATQGLAADVVKIMASILGTARKPRHDDALRHAKKLMDEGATRYAAICATIPSFAKMPKDIEALRRALWRALART